MRSIRHDLIKKKNWPFFCQHSVAVQTEKFPNSKEELNKIVEDICVGLKLNIVEKFAYSFKPGGETLIFILSQSHLAVHVWPEYKVLHFDLVTCTKISHNQFAKILQKHFDTAISYYKWV